MKCEPRPNAHVVSQDPTVHRLEMRAESAHFSLEMSNARFLRTVTFRRLCRCCSRPCRLLTKLRQLLRQFMYRWLAISLHDHGTLLFFYRSEKHDKSVPTRTTTSALDHASWPNSVRSPRAFQKTSSSCTNVPSASRPSGN